MLPHSIHFTVVLLRSSMGEKKAISEVPLWLLILLLNFFFFFFRFFHANTDLCASWSLTFDFPLQFTQMEFSPYIHSLRLALPLFLPFPHFSLSCSFLQLSLLISFPTCIVILQTCLHITFTPGFMKGGSFAELDGLLLVSDVVRTLIGPVVD